MLLGHTCICAVEIEPYCRKILLQRQRDGILPRFPIWDDIRTFDGTPWRGRVDIVCGGFPCQDISTAGKGKGITGERSGLWREMARVVREVGPRYVFVENSPMLTVRGLGTVLRDLAQMGYDARWEVFSAGDVGARHERERIWIAANSKKANANSENTNARGLPIQSRGIFRDEIPGMYWKTNQPRVYGVADDLANWMDRNAAIGNGQVPAVVKLAWETLISK